MSDRSAEDFIELSLDTVGRTRRSVMRHRSAAAAAAGVIDVGDGRSALRIR